MSNTSANESAVPLATGKAHKLPVVPVTFRVYEELTCLDHDILAQGHASVEGKSLKAVLPAPFLDTIQTYSPSVTLEKNGWGKAKPAADRWIYVFRSRSWGGLSLDSEVQVKLDGNQQQFKCVSWTQADRQKWPKQYPRPAAITKKVLCLSTEDEYFVFLSAFQLPYKRIDFYTSAKGMTALKRRCLNIPKGALALSEATPVPIELVDARAVAKKAREKAAKARETYLKAAGEETDAAKRYLADFLIEMAKKEEKLEKWVAMGEVEAFREEQEKKLRKLMGQAEANDAFFYGWMLAGPFQETREDAFASDEKDFEPLEKEWLEEEAELVGDTLVSRCGMSYLEEEAGENSWFDRLLVGGSEGYAVKKPLIALLEGKLGTIINRFLVGRVLWRMKGLKLTETTTKLKKIASVQVEIIKEVEVIVKRLNIVVAQFGSRQGAFLWPSYDKVRKVTRIQYEFGTYEASLTHLPTERWKEGVEKLSKVARAIVLAIEIGNLWHCMAELQEAGNTSDKMWGGAEVASAMCDTIGALGGVLEHCLGEGFEVALKRLSVIGCIIDYALNTRKAFLATDKGKYGLAAGYALTALSSVALGTGAALELGMSGGLAFGLAACPWLLIGAILLILGTALVYWFTESDLEEWAKNCIWGKRGNRGAGKSELGKEIHRLHEILSKFDVECYVMSEKIPGTESIGAGGSSAEYESYLVLKVKTGMFIDGKSRFKIRLDAKDIRIGIISSDDIWYSRKSDEIVFPEPGAAAEPEEAKGEKPQKEFTKRWLLNDRVADVRADDGKYKYDLVAQLDFHGDGKIIYPSEPLKKNGSAKFRRWGQSE
jgi:hypothetical protein